jgi:hypothetical protein
MGSTTISRDKYVAFLQAYGELEKAKLSTEQLRSKTASGQSA